MDWGIAKQAFGFGNIGLGVADISCPEGTEMRLDCMKFGAT